MKIWKLTAKVGDGWSTIGGRRRKYNYCNVSIIKCQLIFIQANKTVSNLREHFCCRVHSVWMFVLLAGCVCAGRNCEALFIHELFVHIYFRLLLWVSFSGNVAAVASIVSNSDVQIETADYKQRVQAIVGYIRCPHAITSQRMDGAYRRIRCRIVLGIICQQHRRGETGGTRRRIRLFLLNVVVWGRNGWNSWQWRWPQKIRFFPQ